MENNKFVSVGTVGELTQILNDLPDSLPLTALFLQPFSDEAKDIDKGDVRVFDLSVFRLSKGVDSLVFLPSFIAKAVETRKSDSEPVSSTETVPRSQIEQN